MRKIFSAHTKCLVIWHCFNHRENGGLGVYGVDYLGYHPKGTTIFPMIQILSNLQLSRYIYIMACFPSKMPMA